MITVIILVVFGSICIFFSGFISGSKIFSSSVKKLEIEQTVSSSSNQSFTEEKSAVLSEMNSIEGNVAENPFPCIGKRQTNDFNSIVDSVAFLNKGRGIVISDQMGFLISSSSDNSEELAAISVLYQQCEKVINRNLSFGKLNQIVFSNDKNLFLTILPLIVDEVTVYISGLSRGRIDYRQMLEKSFQNLENNAFQSK